MSEELNQGCAPSECGTKPACAGCSHNKNPEPAEEAPKAQPKVRKVIGVVSGKGGVGKSLVTSLLAVSMQRLGYSAAILDADITGPSIPRAFGVREKVESLGEMMLPAVSRFGTQIMSINLLLPEESDPVVWRGPVIAGAVGQFWTDVYWKDVDFMFVDMPPGTGDVPLTVFQSLPVDGIIVVTTPQQLVGMIVEKAVKMAEMMQVPVLGLVENMSTYTCPDCGRQHAVFGESHLARIAEEHHLPVLARLPIQPALAAQMDNGTIELFEGDYMQAAADRLSALLPR